MNEYDSEKILNLLATVSYKQTDDPQDAELILINTCSVREKSEQKFFSLLGRLKSLRKKGTVLLGVGGCVAQQEGEKILERAPYVDVIFGTGAVARLPGLIENARKTGKTQIDVRIGEDDELSWRSETSRGPGVSAFVTIMRGCDNFCAFCIVPHVRGRERSRSLDDILEEVTMLAQEGVKEITLLGQNVNSYGGRSTEQLVTFPELLREISQVEGIQRIRFTTSHPKDLSEPLIACFGELEKLCPHIHLPLQSGSNRILTLMNRCYTRDEYAAKVARLRSVCPHIAITTDVIVGFPGETEEDFQATLEFVHQIKYDEFFSFKYSDRPNTQASHVENKVSKEEKTRRLSLLQGIQREITLSKNIQLVGQKVEVLVEGESKRSCSQLTGRSGSNKIVNFKGPLHLKGKLVFVEIIKAHAHSLEGRLS